MTTRKLYLEDGYAQHFEARVLASESGWCALSQTAFHCGGGGQPPDTGSLEADGERFAVANVREDGDGTIWHDVGRDFALDATVCGQLDWLRRYAIMRNHCLLHVVNGLAYQQFGGLVSGAHIQPELSRVDLSVEGFSRDHLTQFESDVNAVIARDLHVSARYVPEVELSRRPELIRTLTAKPPVHDGMVRIVEIEGFDAQACGGTHVHSTSEIGAAHIEKFDNRGKSNKRFYWRLEDKRQN